MTRVAVIEWQCGGPAVSVCVLTLLLLHPENYRRRADYPGMIGALEKHKISMTALLWNCITLWGSTLQPFVVVLDLLRSKSNQDPIHCFLRRATQFRRRDA